MTCTSTTPPLWLCLAFAACSPSAGSPMGGGAGAAAAGRATGAGAGGDANGGAIGGAIGDGAQVTPDMGSAALPAAGEYGTRARLLEPNSEFALATVGTKVYVLGGYPASRTPQTTLQIYDTTTDTWSRGTPYPSTIHHPVTVGVGAKLYSLGGQISLVGASDTGKSFEYDPIEEKWTELRVMPTARGGGAGVAIDNKIYVVGGRPPAANAFEVYDVATHTWAVLPKLPVAFDNRNHIAAGVMGGKVYVAGGRYNGGGFGDPRTAALDMYDPQTNAWTGKKDMLRVRGGMSGVVAFGCFYAYGGEGQGIGEPNDVYPDNDVYNPVTDTWTSLKKLPIPFHGVTGGAFVNGIIYMPGGGITSGGSSGTQMHQTYRPALRCE